METPTSPREGGHSDCQGVAHNHSNQQGGAQPKTNTKSSDTPRVIVVKHGKLTSFGNQGNSLVGIATTSQGAKSFEVWRTSVAVGGTTPLHTHSSEEVFIVLRGKGEVLVGDEVIPFVAPATVIAPAGIAHQLRNTGTEATDQIVIVGAHSKIFGPDGKLMMLPWRK